MTRKIRVLHYSNQLSLGGTERTMESFCRHLNRDRFEVFAASNVHATKRSVSARLWLGAQLGHSKSKAKIKSLRQMNARVPNFKELLGKNLFLLDTPEQLTDVLQKLKIDILHVHTSGRAEFPTDNESALTSVKAVVTTNQFELENKSVAQKYIRKFLFVSRWLLNHKATWATNDPRSEVVYNPIEEPLTAENLRNSLKISDESFVIGRVGRADPGIHDEISLLAYQKIQTSKTWFLALSAPQNMIDQARQLGLINFVSLPATTDPVYLSKFYNTIDVLAHARRDGETFGLNIAEAMIHGKPVVSHLCDFMNAQTEIISDTGFVVAKSDWQAYAQHLDNLMRNQPLYRELSKKARDRATHEFEAKCVTRRLEQIYLDLL